MIHQRSYSHDSQLDVAESERTLARMELAERVCPPTLKLPRFLYAPRREPRDGMIDRHYYEWIDTVTGLRVERDDLCGFFGWCDGIIESEQRS